MFSNTYQVSIYISLQNNNKEEKLTVLQIKIYGN